MSEWPLDLGDIEGAWDCFSIVVCISDSVGWGFGISISFFLVYEIYVMNIMTKFVNFEVGSQYFFSELFIQFWFKMNTQVDILKMFTFKKELLIIFVNQMILKFMGAMEKNFFWFSLCWIPNSWSNENRDVDTE